MRNAIVLSMLCAAPAAHAESRRFLDRPATLPLGGWRAGADLRGGPDGGPRDARVGLDAGLPLALEAQAGLVVGDGDRAAEVALLGDLAGGGLLDLTVRAAGRYRLDTAAWTTVIGVEAQLTIGPVALIAGGDELTFDVEPDRAGRAARATLGAPVGIAVQLGPLYLRGDAAVRVGLRYDGELRRDGATVTPAAISAVAGVARAIDVVARVEAPDGFDQICTGTLGVRWRGGR